MDAIRILLVEDNPDDAEHVRRHASRSGSAFEITVAETGPSAIEMARTLAERPHLILLDVSLPALSGLEVLARMKADPAIADIPTIMLTGSDADDDVRRAMQLGAHSHLLKPLRAADFEWITASIRRYWATMERLKAIGEDAA